MKVDKEYVSETIHTTGKNLYKIIKKLLHEGNIRKLVIKSKEDRVLLEFPLTFGVIGAAVAPFLVVVATLAVLVKECVIYIEKDPDTTQTDDLVE